jgi:Transposase, Mutator family
VAHVVAAGDVRQRFIAGIRARNGFSLRVRRRLARAGWGVSPCGRARDARGRFDVSRKLSKNIYGTIEAWRNRAIQAEHPYVYLDGMRSWAGEVRNVSLLVGIGVNNEGYREILGICEDARRTRRAGAASSSSQLGGDPIVVFEMATNKPLLILRN